MSGLVPPPGNRARREPLTIPRRTRLSPDADWPFVVCLTHDVDRLDHRLPTLRNALSEPSVTAARRLLDTGTPYWRFHEILDLEREHGVTSTFYFLNEQSLFGEKGPRHWVNPRSWSLYSYYDIESAPVRGVIEQLAASAWEVGLQGSYESFAEPERLAHEKQVLTDLVGYPIEGVRQHYLNAVLPETWRHHREIGLRYDTSLGSGERFGFQHGYDVLHPFGDEFAVFPLTVMDQALMASGETVGEIERRCDELLAEAQENRAVLTLDWHQRTFDPVDFPGYAEVYEYLLTEALDRGAWVGPMGAAYDRLVHGANGETVEATGDSPAAVTR